MNYKKISALGLSAAMLVSLAACGHSSEQQPEVTDKKIVLSDENTPAATEAGTETAKQLSYEFEPVKFDLIRDYYKDSYGDNFPILKVKVLADAKMYQFPSEESKEVGEIKKDAEICISQNLANGWSYIHNNKVSGYVKSDTIDQAKVKAVKNPKAVPTGEIQTKPPYDVEINAENFPSTGKKEPHKIYWKNFVFPYKNTSDFSYGDPNIIYGEPSSQMIYKQIGPDFSPYDGKLTYIDGHRHKVAYNMWNNKFGVGETFEITDKDGNAYKYKVVELQQEQYSKNNGYIAATFKNGTSILDAYNFGTPYEGIVIQYCNDASNDPVMNFFLCLPDTDAAATK